jgi:hypothetical protein
VLQALCVSPFADEWGYPGRSHPITEGKAAAQEKGRNEMNPDPSPSGI